MMLTTINLMEFLNVMLVLYVHIFILVILLNIICQFLPNSRLRYYGCYLNYILTVSTLTVLYLPFLLLRSGNPSNILWVYPVAKYLTKFLNIQWELRGENNLRDIKGAAVICMNHQSLFDSLGLVIISPILHKIRNISCKELFYYWPFGLGAWLCGTVFIDRLNGKEANKILDKTAKLIKSEKVKLIIYPEGTRNRTGEKLLPFKRGAFRIAIEAKVPIVPIVYSPYYFIDSEKKSFDRGTVVMKVLTPILTDKMTGQDIDYLMQKTKAIMESEYQQLSEEVHNYN